MKTMVVTFAHQPAGDAPQAFLAIDADQQDVWKKRLSDENWMVFDFLAVDEALTDAVQDGPPHLHWMCAAAFGYGMENVDYPKQSHAHSVPSNPAEDDFERIPARAIPLLYWNEETGTVDIIHCKDFAAREIEWYSCIPFTNLLRHLDLLGRNASSLALNH